MRVWVLHYHRFHEEFADTGTVELPEKCEPGYRRLIECGCYISLEMYPASTVVVAIECPRFGAYKLHTVHDGAEVLRAVELLLRDFVCKELYLWKEQRRNDPTCPHV